MNYSLSRGTSMGDCEHYASQNDKTTGVVLISSF